MSTQILGDRLPEEGGPRLTEEERSLRAKLALSSPEAVKMQTARLGERLEVPLDLRSEEQKEAAEAERQFMENAASARVMAVHDDECPVRKGKECSCRANLAALGLGALKRLEQKGTLVRVDEGREVRKSIPDPLSAQNPPITIVVHEPPRWVCERCAQSIRGTDIVHGCDVAALLKAQSPVELSRSLPEDVKFGGAYRLFLWRDRSGGYHLGEEVVVDGVVKDSRALVGPETYNTIEGALLDFADRNLAP